MTDPTKMPPVIPSRTPRDRVLEHLRTALSVGVASVMVTGTTSCLVVDPVPGPSSCFMGPVAARVTAMVETQSDQVRLRLVLPSGFSLRGVEAVTGGSVRVDLATTSSATLSIVPRSASEPVEFTVSLLCIDDRNGSNSSALLGVRVRPVRINRPDAGSPDAGAPVDAGLRDGGVDAGVPVMLADDYVVDVFDR
jgi:hypothetical protein